MLTRTDSWLAAALLLSACGGGGGGTEAPPAVAGTLTLSTTSVVHDDVITQWSAPQESVSGSISGVTGTVYIFIEQTTNGIGTVNLVTTGETSGRLDIWFRQELPPGTYSDTIVVRACLDQQCTRTVGGSPKTINVVYNHREGGVFTAAPAPLQAAAIAGIVPELPPIDFDYTDGGVQSWTATIAYQSGEGWLSLDQASGPVSRLPQFIAPTILQPLPVGTYRASITFRSNGGTVSLVVPVIYQVLPPRSTPALMSFTADLGSTPETLAQPLALLPAFNDAGSASQAWTASTAAPWLRITPASGDSIEGSEMSVAVISEQLPALDYGVHSTVIRIQGQNGISDLFVPVTLDVRLPRVQYAAPYVIAPDREGDLILRGHGFSAAAGLPLDIGDAVIDDYTVVDDTRILARHPALAAGTHALSLHDPFGGHRGLARLVARASIPVGVYTASAPSLGYGSIRVTVFDHERQAYYRVGTRQQSWNGTWTHHLFAQRFDGMQWTLQEVELPALAWTALLTPDGRELLLIMNGEIQHRDPATLELLGTTTISEREGTALRGGVMQNDGRAVVFVQDTTCGCTPPPGSERARRYDARTRTLTKLPPGTLADRYVIHQNRLMDKLFIGGAGIELIDQQFNVLASGDLFGTQPQIVGQGDGSSRLATANSGMYAVSGSTIAFETIYVNNEQTIAMSHDDRRAYYFHRNDRKIVARDITQAGFPAVGEAGGVPFESFDQVTVAHDDDQLYDLTNGRMTSLALP